MSAKRAGKFTAAAGATLGGTVLFAPVADASTFQVTNLNNDGPGSLRDAVEQANAADGPDTVTFLTGLTGTIELADDGSGTGEDIEIDSDSLDIQGPGAAAITVDGNDLDRIFYGHDFDDGNQTLRISGLTLTGGNAGSGLGGGAIALYGDTSGSAADLTIADAVLTGNEAGFGGAVRVNDGSVTITGSTFSNNETSGYGGGLYARPDEGTAEIRDTTFTGNAAGDGGGGAFVLDAEGDVAIARSTFADNTTGSRGGAINFRLNDGRVSIEESTISGNSAYDGGGVYAYGADTKEVVVARTTVSGNRADQDGGGVLVWGTGGPVTVADSTVSGNAADANDNDNGYGGGIGLYTEFDAGERAIRNSTVTGNSAYDGGGIYNFRRDNPAGGEEHTIISSTIVANNVADHEGNDVGDNTGEPNAAGSFQIGFSLIEDPGATATITNTGPNLTGVDPQLGPLTDNGGPTQTHAPSFSSPVLDQGVGNGLVTDQRGAPRTFDAANVANAAGGDGTDIGAVELLPGGRLSLAQCKGATENLLFAPGTAIVGTDANDVIVGTDAKDSINSGKGRDKVCAGGGNDAVKAGSGKDNVAGQAGKDRIKGNGGNDKLQGNAGKDTLKGGGGKDTLKGGGGKDKLRGGPGKDKLKGGGGKDSEVQ